MTADNPPAVPTETSGEPQPVRASDADRDRIADILGGALAEGRLDAEEHAERVEAAYRAKTRGELEPLIRDLPPGQRRGAPGPPAAPGAGAAAGRGREPAPAHRVSSARGRNVVAVMSRATKQGTWRVGTKLTVVAIMGGVELDLTTAIFEQPYVEITAVAMMGGVEIKVPENVSLRAGGSRVMGGFEVTEAESTEPGAPVVMVRGVAIMGGVEARPVPGKRVRDLRGH